MKVPATIHIGIKEFNVSGHIFAGKPTHQKAKIKFELHDDEPFTLLNVIISVRLLWENGDCIDMDAVATMSTDKLLVKPPFNGIRKMTIELVNRTNQEWHNLPKYRQLKLRDNPDIGIEEKNFELLKKVVDGYHP